MITLQKLLQCMPSCSEQRGALFLAPLNETMEKYEINTPLRMSHFLSQLGHESASLIYTEEIASGAAYEGRKDLGNVSQGDGKKFKGRGLIQLTGRANYTEYGKFVGVDFLVNPKLLATPQYATDSAGWFWKRHHLNELADRDSVIDITKVINGGRNGLDDRKKRLAKCKIVLMN